MVTFWGREITHIDIGRDKLDRMASELGEVCEVEQQPKMEGRNMVMILSPKSQASSPAPKPQASPPEPEPKPQT